MSALAIASALLSALAHATWTQRAPRGRHRGGAPAILRAAGVGLVLGAAAGSLSPWLDGWDLLLSGGVLWLATLPWLSFTAHLAVSEHAAWSLGATAAAAALMEASWAILSGGLGALALLAWVGLAAVAAAAVRAGLALWRVLGARRRVLEARPRSTDVRGRRGRWPGPLVTGLGGLAGAALVALLVSTGRSEPAPAGPVIAAPGAGAPTAYALVPPVTASAPVTSPARAQTAAGRSAERAHAGAGAPTVGPSRQSVTTTTAVPGRIASTTPTPSPVTRTTTATTSSPLLDMSLPQPPEWGHPSSPTGTG